MRATCPLGRDVGVDLDMVRLAIIRRRADCQIGERDRLFDQVRGLCMTSLVGETFKEKPRNELTSTGERNFAVTSTPPAVSTKVLVVDVNCGGS
jgi:hypothetical protein